MNKRLKQADIPILETKDLRKYFQVRGKYVKAVDGINIELYKGETLGIIGESGCGKTTLGKTIIGLHKKTSGEILLDGIEACQKEPSFKRRVQMIFQDPYSSLDPSWDVYKILEEPLAAHCIGTAAERKDIIEHFLDKMGLKASMLRRFPHEFSGGQRQRIGIARALIMRPEIVICDEPISALDVSIQAQVINLLKEIQKEMNLSYLFIAHDLSMVKYISDRIVVMYLGNIVEMADKSELVKNMCHPYTKALFEAEPVADPDHIMEHKGISGEIPSPMNPPSGCKFCTRCPYANEGCMQQQPEFTEIQTGHWVACHRWKELSV
ncbi:MAG: ATP-binding cassette domain-containing protein [Eubacteriales bacterium]|nr:ATP-binding cassette domain-containing protein [Eubacteriales bacterium]